MVMITTAADTCEWRERNSSTLRVLAWLLGLAEVRARGELTSLHTCRMRSQSGTRTPTSPVSGLKAGFREGERGNTKVTCTEVNDSQFCAVTMCTGPGSRSATSSGSTVSSAHRCTSAASATQIAMGLLECRPFTSYSLPRTSYIDGLARGSAGRCLDVSSFSIVFS